MKVIGLTGGIATGKSTVARILRDEVGVPVIDADRVARDVVEPGTDGFAAVVKRFGSGVVRDGRLDRPALRSLIVADALARKDLEAITHPRIRDAIGAKLVELAATGVAAAVVEAALMVETGRWRGYDAVIVVSCDPATQLDRLVRRDHHTPEEARALVATQLPLADKEKVATVVVRNDGDVEALRNATLSAWRTVTASPAGPVAG